MCRFPFGPGSFRHECPALFGFCCSGRSEPLKIAQSAPRAAQNRPERAQSRPESPRASLGRSELFKKPVGEFGDTCTLHIGSQCHLTWFSPTPCMNMHGFTLVYTYIGVRAGARTGYDIPGRDGIGGLDPARNSSAVVVVVAVRGEGEGGGGRDSKY